MNSLGARLGAFYRRLPPATVPLLIIVLAVLVGNIMYVSGLANNDPISWTAGISHKICRVTCGRPMIDPNVGFITQPLGHLSAMDLLHGHMPFWNYFEGLGTPLAGEMQSASFFPLTLLFAFPSGLVWFHVLLEIIAGVSTYFLARRLSIPVIFATAAGVLFALNGTYAWLGNAVLNPVAFLPMLILGIEMIFDSARRHERQGWYVAAIALSLSLYAGFPEVAYLDALFAGGWAILRFFSLPREVRAVAARRSGLAAVVGIVLSLPILVPFLDFMKVASVGGHVSQVDGLARLSPQAFPMLLDPYVYGTLLSNPNSYAGWGGIGGYFSASVVALALLGLFGQRLRGLRIYLGVWSFIGVLTTRNLFELRRVWNLLPIMNTVAFSRYIFPSIEMALIILAALGMMDLATTAKAKRLFPVTTLVALGLLTWSALAASSINRGVVLIPKARIIFIGLHALPFIALGLLLAFALLTRWRVTPLLVALVLCGEALLLFYVPTAESPKQITLDEAPIHYLQAHQGNERFLDFAVLYPNWGSQYNLNELSQVDLPFPHNYADFIAKNLFPNLTPSNQFTIHGGMTGIITQEQAVLDHFQAYENASVKYLLIPSSVIPLAGLAKLGVTKVFADSLATIYEMPHPRPFMSTTASSCTVTTLGPSKATVDCPSATTLLRTELAMPGWHAYVNGREVPITTTNGVYQSVEVPAGTSTVTYAFNPPHEKFGLAAGLLALLFLAGVWVRERWFLRRP
ncbi:MAG TPA: hypothetical protein VMV53_01170 [Acidimicrobiales bacterium]|nr:hypothetical protein [Acidimicrobiales bacterium]